LIVLLSTLDNNGLLKRRHNYRGGRIIATMIVIIAITLLLDSNIEYTIKNIAHYNVMKITIVLITILSLTLIKTRKTIVITTLSALLSSLITIE